MRLAGMGLASAVLHEGLGCSRHADARRRPNILFIVSDQHQANKVGYRGHPVVRTPNLDRLAAGGAHFTRAYCSSPICGPSRMSLLTGKYVHQIGVWLNGVELPPQQRTWADALRESAVQTSAFGKLGQAGDWEALGFDRVESRSPREVYTPWPFESPFDERLAGYHQRAWWLDQEPHSREAGLSELRRAGATPNSEGLHFEPDALRHTGHYDVDRSATDRSLTLLRAQATLQARDEGAPPFLHFVGLNQPHWPFVCPQKYLEMYDPQEVDLPFDARFPNDELHPAVRFFQQARRFEMDEPKLRRVIATYYGMITCMDEMVGELLDELDRSGLAGNTYVVYTSDHGESLGEHGLFDKQTSYEGSVAVPLVIRGPGIGTGQQLDWPLGQVDLHPTLLEIGGAAPEAGPRPGVSLLPRLQGEQAAAGRAAFAEYHGGFFRRDWYMLARENLKYTWYTEDRPSLFDLDDDPHEENDLARDPRKAGLLADLEQALRNHVNPEQTALRAKRECGLIGPKGEDYTETLTWPQLQAGRKSGRFKPHFQSKP